MGLDQYFHATDVAEAEEPLVQLREVSCIQGWMDVKAGKELDNCEKIELSKSDIKELLGDILDAVYRGGTKLEPKSGFSFDSYGKGPDYWFDLGTTYEELRRVYLDMGDDDTVMYHGWW